MSQLARRIAVVGLFALLVALLPVGASAQPEEHPSEVPASDFSADMHTEEIGEAADSTVTGHQESGGETSDGSSNGSGHESKLGQDLPIWSAVPFAGILLSIALFPLIAPHFWHQHYPKVSFAWAILFAVPFLIAYAGEAVYAIMHIYLIDYVPFIILLWGLYTVAGGIVVRGTIRGTPMVNTLMLLIGTLMASWVGTTGAAMVLIRPLLRANAHRKKKTHLVVFFIFLVANVGGSLTPLGDPPLFLGFLHKVPFFWTLNLFGPMAVVASVLLVLFFFLDTRYARREKDAPDDGVKQPLGIGGAHNFLFLGGIIGSVLMSGIWHPGEVTIIGVHVGLQNITRDLLIIAIGLLSLVTTTKALRRENDFSWGPIAEVAYLFAGIFMTIIPALEILKAGEKGHLAGLIKATEAPVHYFWTTGILSSFLDNAPTYLTFFNTALGRFYPGLPEAVAVPRLIEENGVYLLAISAGAVFMGANTYIGNAPNFMVKSIAEEAGVEMPSFFGYLLRWSLPILIPVFVLVTFLFFL